ncbi:MAG: ABC-F family ATP-binding cassette domain-containing protein [Proteobacteria bacterium]|nr:ABC-F family ATP-binding cassette domain-containing protein [Pseudomonadota bacterium]
MSFQPQIILHNISFSHLNQPVINDLSCCFSAKKHGIVGRNGVGKSTLLKLIIGENQPSNGTVKKQGKITYFSQEIFHQENIQVSDVMGVTDKLNALQRIAMGSVNEQDFILVGDDWRLEEAIHRQFTAFGLEHVSLNRLAHSLSGGEYTRLLLAKTFMSAADFLILDEPTNNLDWDARSALYQAISDWNRGLIVVAHDRQLLDLMDHIVELSSLGVNFYGGNYQNYVEQKQIEQASAQENLQAMTQLQKRAKALTQTRRERHEQAQAKGRSARKTEIVKVGILKSRLEMDSAKGRSDRTQRRVFLQSERKLAVVAENIIQAKEKIAQNPVLNIKLPLTQVPNGKMILEIKHLDFKYPDHLNLLIKNFSLVLQGPERVAISGKNGSGKTTLIRLIYRQLKPAGGTILIGTERVNYLDQQLTILDDQLSLLENFLRLNPEIKELDARFYLANFLFRNEAVLKRVAHLSSGERLRAALACTLMSAEPPQLLILDEPTNHLDLYTIHIIESVLREYQGALLVISHDQTFLKNILVEKTVYLS